MSWLKLFRFILILCIQSALSLSLNGQWKGFILSSSKSFTAEVPGGIYTDLERNGLISDNLKGFNDIENRWVANESIAYITTIKMNNNLLNTPYVILAFYGLDTFTTIYVNNVEIGKTSNMFLKYTFEIKKYLKVGQNELKIIFESSVKVAKKMYDEQSVNYVVPPKCVPKEYNGECHVNHIRKMQASYGWDWGPAFPSMGIWRDVELTPIHDIFITDVTTDILKKNNFWEIAVNIFFNKYSNSSDQVDIVTSIEEFSLSNNMIANLNVGNSNISVIINVPSKKVKLWWPNGYGEQKLYLLNVKVKTVINVIERKIKIGFRTVELVQKPLEKGFSFYLKINGIPIFAKGSNWIPSNVFPEKLEDKNTLQNLLKSAKDTYMNMLRVWGGGVYESDLFYTLADEYGIMIWQDFMFACSMYPTTNLFIESVREEIKQNMRRLKNHPSIVIWAGNNENEAALYGNWYGTGKAQIYKDDYIKLYVHTIKAEALKIDNTRPFVVSSPSNGLYSEEQNYTESNPYSNLYGDVHYYNYLRDGWDINQYPITRFASEYGFQALPSIWTLMTASKNSSDLQLKSSFIKHRQHLPQGYNFMKILISRNFAILETNNTLKDLVDYIYLSQITQAVSVKTETELYRQMKSNFNDIGEGLTMGALYWQLNDVWQAPSWSSIDYEGRWKMLHYFAKNFFAPIIITSHLTKANELSIYVVSDLQKILTNVTVEIIVYEWKSSKIIHMQKIRNCTVEANESRLITQYWIDIFLEKAGCGTLATVKENCMIELLVKGADGKQITPSNYVYPISLKKVTLPEDFIEVKIKSTNYEFFNHVQFELEINSQNLALFVWLEMGNIPGKFSENGFHVLNKKKNIIFETTKPVTLQEITKNLMVTSLSRIYNTSLRISDTQIVLDKLDK